MHFTLYAGVNVAGFGYMLALHLDRLGATVFAGCLDAKGAGAVKLKEEGSSRMHILQLDVTSDKQVAECVQYVVRVTNDSGKFLLRFIKYTVLKRLEWSLCYFVFALTKTDCMKIPRSTQNVLVVISVE